MSVYRLKITTKTSERTIILSKNQTVKIPADDNTKYQIFNEQGELVNELKAIELNQEDIGIYLEGAKEPNLILENYYSHYPIDNPQYLSDISASLATGSKDSPFVLASEVGTSGLSKAVVYGLGAVATLGAVFTFFKSGGSNPKKAESESPKTEEKVVNPITKEEQQLPPPPEPNETIEPINVNIQLNSVTADNVINIAEQATNITISGTFTADQPITSSKVVFEVGGQKIDAIVDGNQFKAEVSGNLLAENNQINTTVEVTNDKSKGAASSFLDYLVDIILTHPTISLNEITEDNVINLTESQNTQIISGTVTNTEGSNAKVGDSIVIQLGEHIFNAKLDENLQFAVEINGQILSENNKLDVTLVTTDSAGNEITTKTEKSYGVDTVIEKPVITIDTIAADDVINAIEAKAETITITGSVTNVENSEAKVGDVVRLQVGGSIVEATLTEQLTFSVPVSTIALVNHQNITASLLTKDSANNSVTTEVTRAVTVDTELNLSVSVDKITDDNEINQAESSEDITLSGSYTADADLKDSTVVIKVLVNGEMKVAEVNEADKSWYLTLAGQALANQQGENKLTVQISAEDKVGNQAESQQEHSYQVDTVIGKPVVTITSIADDNVIDAEEAQGAVTIKGIVENSEGNRPVILKCPCGACASGWKEVEAPVVDGKFELTVTVSDTSLANARLKSLERKIKANYTAEDQVGNTADADEASLNYDLDLYSEINITKIGENFTFNPNQMTRISGSITEFDSWKTANNQVRDWYNEGQNAQNIRTVNMVIGDKIYKVGFNGKTKTFQVDIPNEELKTLAGKEISINFADDIVYKYSHIYGAIYNEATKSWSIANEVNRTPTAKSFTLESDALLKTADNIYQIKEQTATTEVSGVVKGSLAKAGAEIEIKIGDRSFITQVKEDKTFSHDVPIELLRANSQKTVTATLKNTGSQIVTDTEGYIVEDKSLDQFVSQHNVMPRDDRNKGIVNRKIDHTKDDYNFFYPIALSELNDDPKYGFHRSYDIGGNGSPLTIKYHFAKESELSNLLQNNFDGKDLSSKPLASMDSDPELKQFLRDAYKRIAEYTNLKFEEVDNYQDVLGRKGTLIMLGNFDKGYAVGASAIAFSGSNLVWNSAYKYWDWGKDFVFYTALHEITHTLNMDHVDNLLKGYGYTPEANVEFVNMSYTYNPMFGAMRDLRLYDLAYLHYRFGVNREHRAGNDVYTFKKYNARSADGDVYIWDGNGVDTFDASNENEGVTVNLTPGSWNYIGTEKKKQFLGIDPTTYSKSKYFDLASDAKFTSQYFTGKTETIQFSNYQEGQSFIGYGTQIENLIGSAFGDTLTGNNANNQIFGGAGDDTIKGGLGNDFINGGEGADLMFGEQGDDIYVVDHIADVVTEKVNEGTDHIYSLIDYTLDSNLEDNVENLTLIGTVAKEGYGNLLNNIIRGNDIGNTLNGLEGDDTLIGGLGIDTLTGGAGKDTFIFESALNGKADIITDFVPSEDKIGLSKTIFSTLNADLSNLNDHLFYDKESGELSYNSASTGIDNAVHFATVSGLSQLDTEQFILV